MCVQKEDKMQAWMRFGLPLGSALIVLAILEMSLTLFYVFIDFGGSLALKVQNGIVISGIEIFYAIMMFIQLIASFVLLWYGVIIKGEKNMMIGWMVTSAVAGGIIIALVLIITVQIWDSVSFKGSIGIVYSIVLYILYLAYVLNLAFRCLPSFSTLEEISPVGKGMYNIVSHFLSSTQDAAMLAVMSEIVVSTELFLERQVLRFVFDYEFNGHERDNSAAILTEEVVLRFIRIALNCLGFLLIIRGKQQWLLKWCMAYAATIAISVIIFMYLIFAWRAEHIVLTLNYYILLMINLFYRAGVLYVCLRYTDVFSRHATHLREVA